MFRERVQNYIPQLDEMTKKPSHILMNLLMKNMGQSSVMFLVWGFNCDSWINELSIILTEDETHQLLVS